MQELEGETIMELVRRKMQELKMWLKPNPADSLMIVSLKMIYKALAVVALIAVSPVILLALLLAFLAAF